MVMNKQILLVLSMLVGLQACSSDSKQQQPTDTVAKNQHLAGGEASVVDISADAFSSRSANMTATSRIATFELGDDFFQNPWVAGSASTSNRDGLGGLFNNNACQDCHIRDGRGHAPTADDSDFASILFRAAKANITTEQKNAMLNGTMANVADAYYGGQLQNDAINNVQAEVDLAVSYQTKTVVFDDGFSVELRKPTWLITPVGKTAFESDIVFSARVSPQMIGLGLLALVSEQDILSLQDINDADSNGISGKANYVWSIENQHVMLGRFGWKAGQPSLLEQAAGAFVNDIGLTNRLHKTENCTATQADCLAAPDGNGDSVNSYDYEVNDIILDAIDLYSHHLAVPQRRNAYDEDVLAGQTLFKELGCMDCHRQSYTTQYSAEHPELSVQIIYPYTDMLLHDMGSELADFNQDNSAASSDMLYEFSATATEWRTPPLWGLGYAKTVDPKATFLHDGRARTILEAILWHGGEAQKSRDAVLKLNAQQRSDLLAFLNDL